MKSDKLRTLTAGLVLAVIAIGLIVGLNVGTLSGFGFDSIALLCPIGALLTMIASHSVVLRAVVSLLLIVVVVFLFGRLFCAWICPVPLLDRFRAFFRSPAKRKALAKQRSNEVAAIAKEDLSARKSLTDKEKALLSESHKSAGKSCGSCSSCGEKRAALDSRHVVLGGAILSTAIFGFPVFCLVCPVGLTFATILLFWRLFSAGDITIAVILVPALLILELTLLKKWCSRLCPISGLMNLVARTNKTFKPVIDESKCLETVHGTACSKCAAVCEFDINLRHPEAGELGLEDCTRCRACVDACPTKAISMPFLAGKTADVVEDPALDSEPQVAFSTGEDTYQN